MSTFWKKQFSAWIYKTMLSFCCCYSPICQEKKRKYEPPVPTRVGKRKKKLKGPDAATKLPQGLLHFKVFCREAFIVISEKQTSTVLLSYTQSSCLPLWSSQNPLLLVRWLPAFSLRCNQNDVTKQVLSPSGSFVYLPAHLNGLTPVILRHADLSRAAVFFVAY